MAILTATNLNKAFGENVILDDTSFFLEERDKVGFIGVNGAGKTTFLKILTGNEYLNSGSIITKNGTKITFLEQEPSIDETLSILENIFISASSDDKLVLEYEAKTILNKMGFTNFDLKVNTLSGGERKRIALAKSLVLPTDILILDEPTNHLDNDMIIWLEEYLKDFVGTVIMVTHDRYFLDRVTNKILELDNGKLYTYSANYSKFLELKTLREESELATKRKNRSIFEKELEWSKRGPQGRGTKSKFRLNRLDELDTGKVIEADKLTISTASTRLGKKTIELIDVSKSFGNRKIISNFNYIISRNERLGIIGKNGMGKSTLLNIMSLIENIDNGAVEIGETVKIGIVNQHFESPKAGTRVIDYIKDVNEFVKTDSEVISASAMLERFLFDKNKQWSVVEKLSGGEKRRLNLLRVLMEAPNILFLDEPTNDLDILTLAILEEYLDNFNGAIITVSHDRYFLDKIVDTILEFNENGTLKKYTGNYSDYLESKNHVRQEKQEVSYKANKQELKKIKKLKFSYNEQREFDTIESDMEKIERQISFVQNEINTLSNQYDKLMPLIEKKEVLESELFEKMERWEYLSDLNNRINSEK